MISKKILKLLFSLEFLIIASITLYFYAATWAASFRLAEISIYQAPLLATAYAALTVSIVASIALLWKNHTTFLRHKVKSLIAIIILLVLLLMTREAEIVGSFMVGMALINSKDRDIFKSIFTSSAILFMVTALLGASVLVAGNKIDTGLFAERNSLTELSALGFTNPNVAYQFFMPILLSGLYLFGKRKRVIFMLAALATLVGVVTGSTAGFLVGVLSCYAFLVADRKFTKRIVKNLAPHGMILITLATFIIASGILPNYVAVNDFFTGRPAFWQLRLENLSFLNLSGNNDEYSVQPPEGEDRCEYIGGGNAIGCFPLDNAPLYIMVHYGIIVFLIYAFVYYRSGKIIRDTRILLIGLLLLLLLMFERANFMNNIYLLFAVKYLVSHYLNKNRKLVGLEDER